MLVVVKCAAHYTQSHKAVESLRELRLQSLETRKSLDTCYSLKHSFKQLNSEVSAASEDECSTVRGREPTLYPGLLCMGLCHAGGVLVKRLWL